MTRKGDILLRLFLIIIQFSFFFNPCFAEEKNYFELPVDSPEARGLSEIQYYKVLSNFFAQYVNLVQDKTGKPFEVKFDWHNNYFGAFAELRENKYSISLWGGMARAEGMTEEVAYTILCHELGHILGGDPKQTIKYSDWASIEGQSDFFATKRCMPHLLKSIKMKTSSISSYAKEICKGNKECETIASASYLTNLFFIKWSYKKNIEVSFEKIFIPEAIDLNLNTYPTEQCRLETMLRGAECLVNKNCERPSCWYPKKLKIPHNELFF